MRRLSGDERGQVAPLVAVCLVGFLAVAGLVIDGGIMFSARRELQSLADGAARAGAMAVDEAVLRETGGSIVLDPEDARTAAQGYLEAAGFEGTFEILATVDSVNVRLHEKRGTVLMSLVGLREFDVAASATGSPRSGP